MESSASANTAQAAINNQKRMQNIVDNLNKMRTEQRLLSQKVAELESDATEHRLVIDALREVDSGRNCYRLIGGILIQQTVQDVLPHLEKNFDSLKKTVSTYKDNVKAKGTAINEYIQQNNLGPLIRSQNAVTVTDSDQASSNEKSSNQKSSQNNASKPSPSVLVG